MISSKTVIFGAVIAVAAGLFGSNMGIMYEDSQKPVSNSLTEGAPILGHVTLIERDSHGNIIAYRQADNTIVNMGLNCMALALFHQTGTTAGTGTSADADACGGTGSATSTAGFNTASGFRYMQIGAGTQGSGIIASMTALGTPTTEILGTPFFTPLGTATLGTGSGGGPNISVTGQFGPLGVTTTVVEAGLFDGAGGTSTASSQNMFARQTFAAITLGTGDTLAVSWQISLSHG